jgi:hypothetical protein
LACTLPNRLSIPMSSMAGVMIKILSRLQERKGPAADATGR